MYRMQLAAALAAAAGLGGWWSPAPDLVPQAGAPAAAMPAVGPESPPAAWRQGDPADSLYRAAREALTRRDYERAATLFASLPGRYPRSGYAADAYYWRAFALYRLGGETRLREALASLRTQARQFPTAGTTGDAQALERRIQGELARAGDSEAAAEVTRAATAAIAPPTPPSPPSAPAPPAPAGRRTGDKCDEDSDDTKLAALNALIHMNAERAQPILRKVLARRDAASACLRQKAVFLVAQGGSEGVEGILLQTARSDPDRGVREQAVFWLSQVEGESAVVALDSILRGSGDAGIQEKAIFALSQHDSPRARAALRAYAERPGLPAPLRERAIFWIGQSGGAENEAFLRKLFAGLKDEELRQKVIFSISQMGGEENGRWLLGVARDRSEPIETRKQALFWAGQSGVPLADLAALYNSADDRAMREQLVFVYSQREEPAAVDKLLEIARRDPDPEMRKKALFWLGQSEDPRAAQALEDIIEQP